jgi:CDP-diacylglycerol--glycerol-3-phosphate 3-phosphatidyltransferase
MESTQVRRLVGGIPHVLSFSRVLLVGITYWAAWERDRPLFAVLVLLAVLTDILDGPLARVSGTASRFGANVDSAADLLFFLSLPPWAYLFSPPIVLDHLPLIVTLTTLYVAAIGISHLTFGALGVHNRLSRTSGTAGVVFTFYTILWGLETFLLYGLVLIMAADLAQRYGGLIAEYRRRRWSFARQG